MKVKAVLFSVIALILGAIGSVLHRLQLNTIYDESTGLALRWPPVSIAVAALCVAAALLALIFALSYSRRSAAPLWHVTLASRTPLPLLLSVLGFAAMLYAAWNCWNWGLDYAGSTLLDRILAVLAALAGLGWLILSISSLRKKSCGLEALSSLFVVLFLCFWLVLSYKAHSSDPTKVKYIYDLLGLCAAAVGSYYLAGFAFGRARPRGSIFFSLLAVSLCGMTMPLGPLSPTMIFSAFTILFLFVNVLLVMLNLSRPQPEEPVEEAEEEAPYEAELPGVALSEPEPEPEPEPELDLGLPEEDLTGGLLRDLPEETDEAVPDLDDILNEFREKKDE